MLSVRVFASFQSLGGASLAQAQCCKGTEDSAEHFCFGVLDPSGRGAVSLSDVRDTTTKLIAWATDSASGGAQAVDAMLAGCVRALHAMTSRQPYDEVVRPIMVSVRAKAQRLSGK